MHVAEENEAAVQAGADGKKGVGEGRATYEEPG